MSSVAKKDRSPARRVARHRRRLASQGLRRVEATVPERDTELVRQVADILRAGGPEAERLRQAVTSVTDEHQARTGEDLLAFFRSSPLVEADIDFERDRSPPRDVDLP